MMNRKLIKMCEEAVMTHFNVLSHPLLGGTGENLVKAQDSQSPS